MAENGGNGLIKGYVYLMVILAVGAGVAAFYFNSVYAKSRKNLVSEAPSAMRRAYETTSYLSPSVGSYFEFRSQGKITDVDKSEFDKTIEMLEGLTREVGLSVDNGVTVKSAPPRETRDKNAPIRHSVSVVVNSCTKAQWQRYIELARQRYGTYAVLEQCKVEASQKVNESKDLTGAIEDASFKYRVTLLYVWYVAPEGSSVTVAA